MARELPSQGPSVRAAMTPTDLLVHPDHRLGEALARLHEARQTFAPVVDGDEIVGVLAVDRIADAAGHAPGGVRDKPVREVMQTEIPFLYEDDPEALGRAIARQTGEGRFCVVDRDGHLTGVLTLEVATAGGQPDTSGTADPAVVQARTKKSPGRTTPQSHGVGGFADAPALAEHRDGTPDTFEGPVPPRRKTPTAGRR